MVENLTESEAASQRARKRGRYTPHACQRCQKAKVRCDGRLPCAYCAAREGDCNYSAQAPPNFQAHVQLAEDGQSGIQELSALLREQNEKLDLLIKSTATIEAAYVAAGKSDVSTAVAVLPPRKQPLPLFQTSTSAFFCINVVDAGVRKLGLDGPQEQALPHQNGRVQTRTALSIIHGEVVKGESSDISRSELGDVADAASEDSPSYPRHRSQQTQPNLLNELERGLLLRAAQAFADLEFPMYPILNMDDVMQKARRLSEAASGGSSGRRTHLSDLHDIGNDDLAILKMVAAIGMLSEGETYQKLASRLFESLHSEIDAMIWSAVVDLKDLILLTLVALFHFHCGRWRLAWRLQGNVSRIILELGLNRKLVLDRAFPDVKSRVLATNTIWTVFVLEQHLSYALGFSNAMPNLRLETNFPQPVDAPFLTLMIDYASIGRQSCDALLGDKILNPEHMTSWQDDYAYFRYRVSLWSMRAAESFISDGSSPGLQMVHTILYLRAGHLKTLVARAFLCSSLREAAPLDVWTIVDTAADTIDVLSQLDVSSREYRFHQAQLNHFLVSALDILLFATTHRSTGVGSPSANGEALTIPDAMAGKARQSSIVALDRLRGLAECSTQSRYLWERVQGMVFRLKVSDYLFPRSSIPDPDSPQQAAAEVSDSPETRAQSGGGPSQSAPLTDFHPTNFQDDFYSFQSGDTAGWGFEMQSSSGLDFDMPQDLSTLLNSTWIP